MKINNQYFINGTRKSAILLIHGINTGALELKPMASFLNDYGFPIYCANLAGHGTYPEDLLHTKMESFIAKAIYDYNLLRQEYDDVYVGGVSTGALLALYLASEFEEIKGVISLACPLELKPDTSVSNKYPDDFVYLHKPMVGFKGLDVQYHVNYEHIAVCIYDEVKRLMETVSNQNLLAKIKCPVIVVQAKDDTIVSDDSAQKLYSMVASEYKELYNPEIGTHDIMLSEGRHETFIRCAKFLYHIEGDDFFK